MEAHPNSPANAVTIQQYRIQRLSWISVPEHLFKYDLNGTTVDKNKVTLEVQGWHNNSLT